MRKLLALPLMLAALGLAGCNTVEGFGQDLKKGADHVGQALGKAGDKISETAAEVSGKAEKTEAAPIEEK